MYLLLAWVVFPLVNGQVMRLCHFMNLRGECRVLYNAQIGATDISPTAIMLDRRFPVVASDHPHYTIRRWR